MTFTRLIVGLGNPGSQFVHTRHNIGGDFVRRLADHLETSLVLNAKLQCEMGIVPVKNSSTNRREDWIMAVPTVHMNLSGKTVKSMLAAFDLPPERLCVAHDCLDKKLARVAIKFGGSSRGHNGLKSIAEKIGTLDFWRIRFGIDRPEGDSKFAVSRYVLGKWTEEQEELLELCLRDTVEKICSGDSKLSFQEDYGDE